MNRSLKSELRAISNAQRAHLVVRGVTAFANVRDLILELLRENGYRVVLDPSTPPDLMDVLAIGGDEALDGAVVGGLLGFVVGALLGAAGGGAAIGTGLGLIAGAARGAKKLERGWRLRAAWDCDGTTPILEVLPLA